ncbi:tyrosine-type recombinase/integrase [Spirosoma sp. KCTC 42546]|uniref:tyrosine-type recombinase/integrase n=1 Tax=Spirosoma sp. KCTC 42546 TaxID=2520506 RepID=UPI001157CFD8|nr:tyrosine-type recombinase/integrase [Spirosoma sp. KCTC 42546]QDK79670.1 tyrosine-type recombinase/integrase [Spirosoma sp. KCTC 42546]
MARLTFNVELNSKPDRSGRWQVMVRLHQKGQKPGRVLTTVKIENAARFWDAELLKKEREKNPDTDRKVVWGKWVVKHPEREVLNEEILQEYERIKKQATNWLNEFPYLTPTLLAERFREGVTDQYFPLLDDALEQVKEQAYTTYACKLSARTLLKSFLGDRADSTYLQSVTPILVREFRNHLKTKAWNSRGDKRKASTINEIIGRLNNLHEQILIKKGLSEKQAALQSPWTEIEALPEIKTPKTTLTDNIIDEIKIASFESKRKVITHDIAFHIWMLSRVLAGARISDVIKLRYQEFDVNQEGEPVHLRYQMLKTGHLISTPVFEEARLLLKRWWNPDAKATDYVLPLLNNSEEYARLLTHEQYKKAFFEVRRKFSTTLNHWNKSINGALKEIEVGANLSRPLRMHSSRHSFADLALRIMKEEASLTLYDIQLMMGHQSLKTTEIYTKDWDEKDISQPMQVVFRKKG